MIKVDKILSKKITILLTVYNRNSLTIRWLEFADFFQIPFQIFVADGGSGNFIKNYIKNRNFENIKVQYKKYKYYKNWKNINEKFSLATSKIKTKYIYLCEDDDFIIFKNILKSLNFLEKNPDFVCCGGFIYEFDINFRGLVKFYHLKFTENLSNINKDLNKSQAVRILSMIKNSANFWNFLHRTKSLRKNFKQINIFRLKDLYMHETAFNINLALQGKIKRLNHVEYLKTTDIKTSNSFAYENSKIFYEIVKNYRSTSLVDANKILTNIKKKLYLKNKKEFKNIYKIKELFDQKIKKKYETYYIKKNKTQLLNFNEIFKFFFKKVANSLSLYNLLKKINLTLISYRKYKNFYFDKEKSFLDFNINRLFYKKLTFFLENFKLNKSMLKNKTINSNF